MVIRKVITEKQLTTIKTRSKEFTMSRSIIEDVDGDYIYSVYEPELSADEKEVFLSVFSKIKNLLTEEDAKKNLEGSYKKIENLLQQLLKKQKIKLSEVETVKLIYFLYRDLIGINIAESFLADPDINYILCKGLGRPIFINHEKYGLLKTNVSFKSRLALGSAIWRLMKKCKKISNDKKNGILGDKSFVETDGLRFSIRKQCYDFGPEYLLKSRVISPGALAYIWMHLKKRHSVLIVGPKNSGKTNFLSGLLAMLPEQTKISIVEDKPHLGISNVNWTSRVASLENLEKTQMLYEDSRRNPDFFAYDELDAKSSRYVFQYLSLNPGVVVFESGNTDIAVYKLTHDSHSVPKSALANFDVAVTLTRNRRVEEILEILKYDEKKNELIVKIAYMEENGKLVPGESRFLRSLSESEYAALRKKTKEFISLR